MMNFRVWLRSASCSAPVGIGVRYGLEQRFDVIGIRSILQIQQVRRRNRAKVQTYRMGFFGNYLVNFHWVV